MTEQTPPAAIARAYTEAWTSHDMSATAGYLADDVTFEGPANRTTGADAYMAALSAFAQRVTGMKLLAAHGDDTQALIMYDVTMVSGDTLTCAELLTFHDGKIQSDRLTFAPRKPPAD